ncbi:MAG: FadR/GntR family transcriptional regulator [Candidatus Bathyarchaeia archaeon]
MILLRKLQAEKKSIFVAEQILEAIANGKLKPGDKLPPENAIAEQTNVSRTSVREALSALELVGVIKRRAGDGTYVKNGLNGILRSRLMDILEEGAGSFEALEARMALEPGIAALACKRATPEDIRNLSLSIKKLKEVAKKRDYDRFLEMDYEFHLILARSAKNALLIEALQSFLEVMKRQLWRSIKERCLSSPGHMDDVVKEHERIFAAINSRNQAKAISETERHFKGIMQRLELNY